MQDRKLILRFSEFARDPTDVIVDYVIYMCPVRKEYAFALEDKWANYWTAADWTINGCVWGQQRGTYCEAFRINDAPDDLNAGVTLNEMADKVKLYMDCLNHYTMPDPIAEQIRCMIAPIGEVDKGFTNQNFVVIQKQELEYGPDVPEIPQTLPHLVLEPYNHVREAWIEAFEVHYPRPVGAVMDVHHISVRAAREAHRRAVRKQRRKQRETIQAMGLDVETIQPPLTL